MEIINWLGSLIKCNDSYEGEPIERELERLMDGDNTLTSNGAPIYTKKGDGVLPEYDIRTNRMDIAEGAMNKVNITRLSYRPWEPSTEDGDNGENGQ